MLLYKVEGEVELFDLAPCRFPAQGAISSVGIAVCGIRRDPEELEGLLEIGVDVVSSQSIMIAE